MPEVIDAQLRWFTEALTRCGIAYWLDSGALLGLVRGGKLMDHDNDIDISIWREDEPKLARLADEASRGGYSAKVLLHEGRLFKVKFARSRVPAGEMNRWIDINLFERAGALAICPQPIIKPRSWKGPIDKLYRVNLARILDRVSRNPLRRSDLDSWPWPGYFRMDTWRIPVRFFEQLAPLAGFGCAAPEDLDGYLTLRYGDWRVPRRDWNFPIHDGGLAHKTPAEVRAEALSATK